MHARSLPAVVAALWCLAPRFVAAAPPDPPAATTQADAITQRDAADARRIRLFTADDPPADALIESWDRATGLLARPLPTDREGTLSVASRDLDRILLLPDHGRRRSGPWTFTSRDGEAIRADVAGGNAEVVLVRHPAWGETPIPFDRLAAIRRTSDAQPLDDPGPPSRDRVWLSNGDVLTGVVAGISSAELRFTADAGEQSLPLDIVRAVRLADAAPSQRPALSVLLHLADGSTLRADDLEWEPDRINVAMFGRSVRLDPSWLSQAEVVGGRRVWLGEIAPEAYESLPVLGPAWPLAVDRGATGRALRVAGETARRGLGLHAACRLRYRLNKEYARFRCSVGIADDAGPLADASVRFGVDGRGAAAVEGLRHRQSPRPVSIDLAGADALLIEVDAAANGDVHDRVNLLDAALIRR